MAGIPGLLKNQGVLVWWRHLQTIIPTESDDVSRVPSPPKLVLATRRVGGEGEAGQKYRSANMEGTGTILNMAELHRQ